MIANASDAGAEEERGRPSVGHSGGVRRPAPSARAADLGFSAVSRPLEDVHRSGLQTPADGRTEVLSVPSIIGEPT